MTRSIKLKSKTLSLSLSCPAHQVYKFVSNLKNLPKWATTFAKSIQKKGPHWILETLQGPVQIRMCKKNTLGVLDHFILTASGEKIYVPMRVVPNSKGSEITFTLFKRSTMSQSQFSTDLKLVKKDLKNIKKLMEEASSKWQL